ncbi:MAG: response regulator [bacterium]|nr:response regulator [bacterium]
MSTAKKILIIEDDALLGELLLETLKKNQYEVRWARDGVQGLQRMREFRPDLVLLDIAMPRMDGYQVLDAKVKDATMKDIPVIVISNSGEPVELNRILPLGVKDYLVKVQLTPEEVLEKVKSQFAHNEPRVHTSPGISLKGKKILWAEDDDFLINLITRKLAKEEAVLITSRRGGEIVALAEKEAPDIIMLDILMPDLDGLEILSRLKANEKTKSIPVIMFSNLDDEAKTAECRKLGAASFFLKAKMDLDEIVSEVKKAIFQHPV